MDTQQTTQPESSNREYFRTYQKAWIANRRQEWFAANGPCVKCASWDRLELHHRNPEQKVSHRIWSWSVVRLEAEAAKCDVLCHDCHRKATIAALSGRTLGGKLARRPGGSGVPNVYEAKGSWVVKIQAFGETHRDGPFPDKIEAARAAESLRATLRARYLPQSLAA